jgi:hypothetical protein
LNLSGVRVGVVVVGWTEIHPSARQMKTVCFSDFHSAWNLIGKSNDDSLTHSNRFPFLNSILHCSELSSIGACHWITDGQKVYTRILLKSKNKNSHTTAFFF